MGRAFEYRRASKEARWDKMSKIFPKLARAITMAAKEGGADPDSNAKLRSAIQNAKAQNMPKDNVDKAIARLRKDYRVVIFSARCRSEEGRVAIQNWLAKHRIEVDEVCENKPPAFVYVDDRAVEFRGDWSQTIEIINSFRR